MRRGRATSLEIGPLTFTRFTPPRAGLLTTILLFTLWASVQILRLAWWTFIALVALVAVVDAWFRERKEEE